jgi:hypothetical protein
MSSELVAIRFPEKYLTLELQNLSLHTGNLPYNLDKKERIIEGLPFLPTCAASFGCQLVYAANLCCQLGMLAITGFKPGTAAL